MLSEAEKRKIQTETAHYADLSAAIGEALQVVQESRGWVSDEGIADVAEALGLTPEEVDGVATFFELIFRKPVGKHVILICDSVSCWITGYDKILEHLRWRLGVGLGETTGDRLFTLLPAGCLGACEVAPAMMIDGELFGNLTPERIDRILSRYGGNHIDNRREGPHGDAAH